MTTEEKINNKIAEHQHLLEKLRKEGLRLVYSHGEVWTAVSLEEELLHLREQKADLHRTWTSQFSYVEECGCVHETITGDIIFCDNHN